MNGFQITYLVGFKIYGRKQKIKNIDELQGKI